MVCRGRLLLLHRAGEIELPPIRFRTLNPFVRREAPAPMLIDTTPIAGALSALRPIELQQVRRTADEPLKRRAAELPAPIQMCDALSRNAPKSTETLLANCLAHGRRQFVELVESFPEECRYVLEALRGVYHNDASAREQQLSPEERLRLHQEHSGPLMKQLHDWMEAQFAEHKTEPNSGLGKAISYLLNHWTKLTLFLRQAGAPIDNNIVERALKKAILNRKNALFYKTVNGAWVGDLFMRLIHTCELNDANPFDYLAELQRHAEALKQAPAEWMPWNYRETLQRLTASTAA
jgi:transposase